MQLPKKGLMTMANPEHLAILIQGVEVWNRWREENPEIRPDLREGGLWVAHIDVAEIVGDNFRWSLLWNSNGY